MLKHSSFIEPSVVMPMTHQMLGGEGSLLWLIPLLECNDNEATVQYQGSVQARGVIRADIPVPILLIGLQKRSSTGDSYRIAGSAFYLIASRDLHESYPRRAK